MNMKTKSGNIQAYVNPPTLPTPGSRGNAFNRFRSAPRHVAYAADENLASPVQRSMQRKLDKENPTGFVADGDTGSTPSGQHTYQARQRIGPVTEYVREEDMSPLRRLRKRPNTRKKTTERKRGRELMYSADERSPVEADLQLKDLARVTKEKMLTQGKRQPSQGRAMGNTRSVGAKEAAEDLYGVIIPEGSKVEWLHLIAHRFLGNERAQKAINLVVGTKEANSVMLLVENVLADYISCGHNVKLTVTPDVEEETHIAEMILYSIKFKDIDCTLTFIFDASSHRQPYMEMERAISVAFEAIYETKTNMTVSISDLFTKHNARKVLAPIDLNVLGSSMLQGGALQATNGLGQTHMQSQQQSTNGSSAPQRKRRRLNPPNDTSAANKKSQQQTDMLDSLLGSCTIL